MQTGSHLPEDNEVCNVVTRRSLSMSAVAVFNNFCALLGVHCLAVNYILRTLASRIFGEVVWTRFWTRAGSSGDIFLCNFKGYIVLYVRHIYALFERQRGNRCYAIHRRYWVDYATGK